MTSLVSYDVHRFFELQCDPLETPFQQRNDSGFGFLLVLTRDASNLARRRRIGGTEMLLV